LAILRAHAQVVLVGAATVREEDYGPLRHTPERERLRRELGFTTPARLAVVTAHPTFTGTERWIAEAPVPPLVLTTDSAACTIPGAEVVACGDGPGGWIEPPRIIEALTDRSLEAVLCEGGPHVMGQLTDAGLVDELCLTLSPILVGPGTPRIVAGGLWDRQRVSRLTQLLEADGLLFARYVFDPEQPG
jgi:riboflavin biosynthesis pyrimidine reductase